MSWRRALEFPDGTIVRTAWDANPSGWVMELQIDSEVHQFETDEVEALHQFTFEILAGRRTDPRLDVVDAEIRCGSTWRVGALEVECCLSADHEPIASDIAHVTSRGTPFCEDVPF